MPVPARQVRADAVTSTPANPAVRSAAVPAEPALADGTVCRGSIGSLIQVRVPIRVQMLAPLRVPARVVTTAVLQRCSSVAAPPQNPSTERARSRAWRAAAYAVGVVVVVEPAAGVALVACGTAETAAAAVVLAAAVARRLAERPRLPRRSMFLQSHRSAPRSAPRRRELPATSHWRPAAPSSDARVQRAAVCRG